jgi:hypothetical protein
MFGLNQQAKVPNSSQYDFKGASVAFGLFRLNRLPVLTNPLRQGRAIMDQQPVVPQADPNQTKVVDSPINYKTKPINLKGLNIELPWPPRIPTIQSKTSKNWKRKSTSYLRNA